MLHSACDVQSSYPKWELQFSPRQLRFMLDCIDRTAGINGAIVEIGCATGMTTTFLSWYLRDSQITKKYVCIDTFSGFTKADLAHEQRRGNKYNYRHTFGNNSRALFKEALATRGIHPEIIQADICKLAVKRYPSGLRSVSSMSISTGRSWLLWRRSIRASRPAASLLSTIAGGTCTTRSREHCRHDGKVRCMRTGISSLSGT